MKIYENLDLVGNKVSNVVIGTTGSSTEGAIKYVSSSNKLQLYYAGEWHDIGGSSTTTNYVNGKFTIGPSTSVGTGTQITGTNTMEVWAKATGSSGTETALKCRMNGGNLIVGTATGTNDQYISLNVASSVAGEMVFFSTFNSGNNTTISVDVENPLKSSNVVVSVYQKFFYKLADSGGSLDREGWEKIGCEVAIRDAQDGCSILLTLSGVSANQDFKVVVVGAPSTISGSGSSSIENPSSNEQTITSDKITSNSPIERS